MLLALFVSSEIEYKEKHQRDHNRPVGFTEPQHNGLMYADDQKANGKREENNIRQFHR
jgi:hypothetical protein